MNDFFKDLDSVDLILIISVLFLSYIAFSGNYEYMDSVPMNVKDDVPMKVKDDPPMKVKDVPPIDLPTKPKLTPENSLPDSKSSSCEREYDNTMDSKNLMGSPLKDQMLLSSKTEGNEFQANGYMDPSENMGINLCDLDKPIAGSGVQVYNSSSGLLKQLPSQNIVNSTNIFQHEMDTKNILNISQSSDGLPDDGLQDDGLPDDRYHVDMIKADWCGYCKKAKPEFDKVKEDHHGKSILGIPGFFNDYDEKKDSDLIGKDKKYDVDGFPTFFLTKVVNGVEQQPIKFNAITYDSIIDEIKKYIN